MLKTFYRVGHKDDLRGLWHDQNGEFTGEIKERFSFCKSSHINSPFTEAVKDHLPVIKGIKSLFKLFPLKDLKRLQNHGFMVLEYETEYYLKRDGYYLIQTFNSELVKKHSWAHLDRLYGSRNKEILGKARRIRAENYAKKVARVCVECEGLYPPVKMEPGRNKCKGCFKDLERLRARKRAVERKKP